MELTLKTVALQIVVRDRRPSWPARRTQSTTVLPSTERRSEGKEKQSLLLVRGAFPTESAEGSGPQWASNLDTGHRTVRRGNPASDQAFHLS